MKVYITGIAGFLGSHLSDFLLARGIEVSGCDDLSTGERENVSKAIEWHCGEIEELPPEALEGVSVVFHCAAAAYEGVSVFSPGFISRNIYAGSAAVFSAAIAAGVKRVVFTSSMARYGRGSLARGLFRETDACHPVDPYGLAKYSAEKLLTLLAQTHGIEAIVAVPHSIYGPRQKYDDPYRNVCAIMANRMLQGKPPIIYGKGDQVRCFSYVDDVVPTLARLGLDSNVTTGSIWNIGPDRGDVTINQLASILGEIIGVNMTPVYLPPRPREVKYATCSADKARYGLDFESRTGLQAGLMKLVEDIRARGPKPFDYHLDIEIKNGETPKTWTERLL